MLIHKKGEIGATLTWIVALIAILVILFVLLLPGSIILSKTKSVLGYNINYEKQSSLVATSSFVSFLESPVNEGDIKVVSDRFFYLGNEENAKKLEEGIKRFANTIKSECYSVKAGDFEVEGLTGLGGRRYSLQYKSSFLEERGSVIYLLNNGKSIKLDYYFGKC